MNPTSEHKINTILQAVDQNLLTLTEWEENFINNLDNQRNIDLSWKRQKALNHLFNKIK